MSTIINNKFRVRLHVSKSKMVLKAFKADFHMFAPNSEPLEVLCQMLGYKFMEHYSNLFTPIDCFNLVDGSAIVINRKLH